MKRQLTREVGLFYLTVFFLVGGGAFLIHLPEMGGHSRLNKNVKVNLLLKGKHFFEKWKNCGEFESIIRLNNKKKKTQKTIIFFFSLGTLTGTRVDLYKRWF